MLALKEDLVLKVLLDHLVQQEILVLWVLLEYQEPVEVEAERDLWGRQVSRGNLAKPVIKVRLDSLVLLVIKDLRDRPDHKGL